jgi:hypothetical protein
MVEGNNGTVFSKKIRAGKRTYYVDVKATREQDDFYIVLTESKKQFRRSGGFFYERHQVFLYKEDFNKILEGLSEAVALVKTELLPDYDYEAYDRSEYESQYEGDLEEEQNEQSNGRADSYP